MRPTAAGLLAQPPHLFFLSLPAPIHSVLSVAVLVSLKARAPLNIPSTAVRSVATPSALPLDCRALRRHGASTAEPRLPPLHPARAPALSECVSSPGKPFSAAAWLCPAAAALPSRHVWTRTLHVPPRHSCSSLPLPFACPPLAICLLALWLAPSIDPHVLFIPAPNLWCNQGGCKPSRQVGLCGWLQRRRSARASGGQCAAWPVLQQLYSLMLCAWLLLCLRAGCEELPLELKLLGCTAGC